MITILHPVTKTGQRTQQNTVGHYDQNTQTIKQKSTTIEATEILNNEESIF